MRKDIGKQALIYSLIGSMVLGNTLPAFAYTDSVGAVENQDVNESSSANTTVYAELGSDFRVIIPKHIVLDGALKKGAYTVSVEGDIAGTEYIKVVPDASFALTSNNLANVTAYITQDKTEWVYSEMLTGSNVISNGEIDASGISAGSWNGNFNFNVSLEENSGSEVASILTLSEDDVKMGSTDSVQVNAFIDGENVNDIVSWNSDNENIIVANGLVETKANAQVGDTATVTVSATSNASLLAEGEEQETATAQFTVTIIDMAYTASGEDEVITSIDLKAGESKDIEVTIIPASATGTVSWTTTAPSGINLIKNGNTVTVKIADDMASGNSYDLVASYGNLSKLLKINIVADEVHTHSYTESTTQEATCIEAGVKTFICSCGDSYTEEISATGHNYENGTCTECGDAQVLEAGLYDENGVMLCSWADSGINIVYDYSMYSNHTNYYATTTTSPYYIITNNYPTTTRVILPNNITKIGALSFFGLNAINSVNIPEGVTYIGERAFTGTNITTITVPAKVTNIGGYAFMGCKNLTTVYFEQTTTPTLGNRCFYNLADETTFYFKNSAVRTAFYNGRYTTSNANGYYIPDYVTLSTDYSW